MTHTTAKILSLGIIFLLGMESGIALNLQPARVTVKPVTVYQPTFIPIKSHSRYYGEQLAKIEASIPATALRRK